MHGTQEEKSSKWGGFLATWKVEIKGRGENEVLKT